MSRRSVRLLLVLLALTAASAAAYRGFTNEVLRQQVRASAIASDQAAEQALAQMADLRASQYAYVAAGQGEGFWTSHAAALLDGIRSRVLQLDAQQARAATPELLDGLDRLSAADKRAKDYLAEGQPLLAADVIFAESRELIDAVNNQIAGVRSALAIAAGGREAALVREQYLLAAGALGAWVFVALLLLPRTAAAPDAATGVLHVAPQPEFSAAANEPDLALNQRFDDAGADRPPPRGVHARAEAPPAASAAPPPAPAQTPPSLAALASVCGDLARVTDAADLNPLLDRAALALDASGLILWMAGADGALHPAAAHGYDAKILSRLGPVPPDAGNLTALVFSDGAARGAASSGQTPAALAVPVVGPAGAIGVLSAELKPAAGVTETIPCAAIVAAQLAALLGAPAAGDAATDQPAVLRTGS